MKETKDDLMLIIPDIHGRTFWKEPCRDISEYSKVIFLGDYMDPYPFEDISVESALDNFREIIRFARSSQGKVILLLGNHDIYYWYKQRGPSRWSREFHTEIEKVFDENRDLFKLVHEEPGTLFSHSGYSDAWADASNRYMGTDIAPTEESLNALLEPRYMEIHGDTFDGNMASLMMVSRDRGGRWDAGSLIWADVDEHQRYATDIGKYQVFGHTMQLDLGRYYQTYNNADIKPGEPIITLGFAMLDCQHAFRYEEKYHCLEKIG